MSEQHPNPQWELMKTKKLDNFHLRAKFADDNFIHDQRYKMIVPPEKQEKASTLAEVFAGEVMDFFKDNPTGKLKPLQPSREQVDLMYFLLESVENGTLVLKKTEGRIQEHPQTPYLFKLYEAGESSDEGGDIASQLSSLLSDKRVSFAVRWDVNRELPLEFTIFGDIGLSMPGTMDFIILPQKAELPGQVDEHLGRVGRKDMITGVYQNGERVILNREAMYQGKEYSRTDQYYLVGAFNGVKTEKTYWVYGSNNDKNHTMTVR